MLGTTFGGNHLTCTASLAVLEIIQKSKLQQHAKNMETYFRTKAEKIKELKSRVVDLCLDWHLILKLVIKKKINL